MSEYQYYEFQAIDRPLTSDELAYVRTLSRRVQATPGHAIFTYSYGDFRGEPLKLLARQYDAMIYIANWGARQLAFRFPRAAIELERLRLYDGGVEQIELQTLPQHVIVSMTFHEEQPGDWIEGEGVLASLVPLREDMLGGDLRALYLAWLKAAMSTAGLLPGHNPDDEWDDAADEAEPSADELIEPPVPPGLTELSASLEALVEFLGIDRDLLTAAAQASQPLQHTDQPLEQWVALLPEAERNAFLVRVARGERVSGALLRRLREIGGTRSTAPADERPRRRLATILAAAQELRQQRREQERQQAEQARLRKLAQTAQREAALWTQVESLIEQKTPAAYDQAVAILTDLRDLAVHRGQQEPFSARIAVIQATFSRRPSLIERLRTARLI